MESFQRKPNGGNSSSTAYVCDTESKKTIKPVGRIRRIAPLCLKLMTQFAFQVVIFACLVCILRFAEHLLAL
ncbi:MAG: hypothetical protein DMF43_01465 [Verrucomicrobia bacterium]|nr:MAG: hypothetical protein DMF43_01465 [Verrucomicrobiota bacterium]